MEEKKEVIVENKMGTQPVGKLLLSMSVPMIISMLIQALYNVVDSIFVAQISEDALTAVSLVFPIQSIMIAVATGTFIGVNAILSKRLGEKRVDDANKVANVSVVLSLLSYVVFLLVGIFMSRWFFEIQTDNPDIIEYGNTYMSIVCVFSFGLFLQMCFEKLLQATGRTFYSMIIQIVGAIINIILDPILIFGYFGFPKMGMAGAAVATVVGQIVGMILGFVINAVVNKEITLRLKYMIPEAAVVKSIYKIAVPAILMQSIGSVTTFIMNKILMGFTSTATAVFGIFYKLQSFVFMPIFGLNNGMIPIVSFNYGARRKDRMMQAVRYSITIAIVVMLVGLILAETIPGTLLLMFDASENMLIIGRVALRILCTCFVFAGYNIVSSGLFQAVGKSTYSLIMSLIRQVAVLLPVAFLLSLTGKLELVWLAFPIAEVVAVVIAFTLRKRVDKQLNF